MDVPLAIKARLQELALEQKELARAAEVTESYISQILTRKKLPPAPDRTDIYVKIERFLQLKNGELAKLALAQRSEQLMRHSVQPAEPMLGAARRLVLRKCTPAKEQQLRAIFERQPFGELEQLVMRKMLDVVGGVARQELENQLWLQCVAQLSDRSYEQMRVIVLEFLDTDIFHLSNDDCIAFLDPLISSWDIDLTTFDMEIKLNERLVPGDAKAFSFVEKGASFAGGDESALSRFVQDSTLCGDISTEEIEFLRRLSVAGKQPNSLFYYRALQLYRDPVHFEGSRQTIDPPIS